MDRLAGWFAAGALTLVIAGLPALAQASGDREVEGSDRERKLERLASNREDPEARERDGDTRQILYTPPAPARGGAPIGRTGGGTRSTGPSLAVHALAPTHVARTLQSAPTLFWHVDAVPPQGTRIAFTLIDETSIDPIASFDLSAPQQAGIQAIRLADHGVVLDPDVEYEWSVAVVLDPEKRSHDVIGRAWLQRVEVSGLDTTAATASDLAARSLWYDAFESLSVEIDAAPSDTGLRQQRNALLRQVGLDTTTE